MLLFSLLEKESIFLFQFASIRTESHDEFSLPGLIVRKSRRLEPLNEKTAHVNICKYFIGGGEVWSCGVGAYVKGRVGFYYLESRR